jgi:hypothetical protein
MKFAATIAMLLLVSCNDESEADQAQDLSLTSPTEHTPAARNAQLRDHETTPTDPDESPLSAEDAEEAHPGPCRIDFTSTAGSFLQVLTYRGRTLHTVRSMLSSPDDTPVTIDEHRYDGDDRLARIDRRHRAHDFAVVRTVTYDRTESGQIKRVTYDADADGSTDLTETYHYGLDGRVTTINVHRGKTHVGWFAYKYSGQEDLPWRIETHASESEQVQWVEYVYNDNGKIQSYVKNISGGSAAQIQGTYEYDNVGNVLRVSAYTMQQDRDPIAVNAYSYECWK